MSHVHALASVLAPARSRSAILCLLTLASAATAAPAQAADRVEISGQVAQRCWATEASMDLSRPVARCSQGNLALSITTRRIGETRADTARGNASKSAGSQPEDMTEQPTDRAAVEIIVSPTL